MDTLDRIRKELQERVAELEPLAREYERLKAAHAALEPSSPAPSRAADRARPARGARAPAAGAKPGSARAAVLASAREHPDAKRGDIAQMTGLSAATVSTTLAKLRAEGLLPRPARRGSATSSGAAAGGAETQHFVGGEASTSRPSGSVEPGAAGLDERARDRGEDDGHDASSQSDTGEASASPAEEPAQLRSRPRRSPSTETSTTVKR